MRPSIAWSTSTLMVGDTCDESIRSEQENSPPDRGHCAVSLAVGDARQKRANGRNRAQYQGIGYLELFPGQDRATDHAAHGGGGLAHRADRANRRSLEIFNEQADRGLECDGQAL